MYVQPRSSDTPGVHCCPKITVFNYECFDFKVYHFEEATSIVQYSDKKLINLTKTVNSILTTVQYSC